MSDAPALILETLFQEGWHNYGIYEVYWCEQKDPVTGYLYLEKSVHTRVCIWFQAPQYKKTLAWTGLRSKFKTWGICTLGRWSQECETDSLFPRKIYRLCMKALGRTCLGLFSIYHHIRVSVSVALKGAGRGDVLWRAAAPVHPILSVSRKPVWFKLALYVEKPTPARN